MRIFAFTIIFLLSFQAIARSQLELQRRLEYKYLPNEESSAEGDLKELFLKGYKRMKNRKDSEVIFYKEFKKAGSSSWRTYLDSPIDKIEQRSVRNPVKWVGRLFRNTVAGIFGVDRDMISVRLTSKSRKTFIDCYYVVPGFENYSYLYKCGPVKDRNLYRNEELFEIESALEKAQDCRTANYIYISSRAWRENEPTDAKELSLFKEFDEKIGFKPISKLRDRFCDEYYLVTNLAEDLAEEFKNCSELLILHQEINSLYDRSDIDTQRLFDEKYRPLISAKISRCRNLGDEGYIDEDPGMTSTEDQFIFNDNQLSGDQSGESVER